MTLARLTNRRLVVPTPAPAIPLNYPPALASWTWVNQGSATIDARNVGHVWTQPAAGAANLIGRIRPYTGTITVTAEFAASQPTTNDAGFGLGFRSASGQITIFYIRLRDNQNFEVENWTSPTAFSSVVHATGMGGFPLEEGMWLQVADNGTDLFFNVAASENPDGFQARAQVGRTSFLTGGPTSVGWWNRDANTANVWTLKRWVETA